MDFHKDLSSLGWEEVRRRQLHRMSLVKEWIDLVQLNHGDYVLDIGPGPGVFTLKYAEVVGPEDKVTAIEKSDEAIEYLVHNLSTAIHHLDIVQGDAETFDVGSLGRIDAVMVTDILHHADAPDRVLRNLSKLNHVRLLISEFDPESDGLLGPPLDKRLKEETVVAMLLEMGYTVAARGKQLFEHYYIVATTH